MHLHSRGPPLPVSTMSEQYHLLTFAPGSKESSEVDSEYDFVEPREPRILEVEEIVEARAELEIANSTIEQLRNENESLKSDLAKAKRDAKEESSAIASKLHNENTWLRVKNEVLRKQLIKANADSNRDDSDPAHECEW